ncbi:MAG: peptidylprolyl isomerase [Patescibacteria group bacterium]
MNKKLLLISLLIPAIFLSGCIKNSNKLKSNQMEPQTNIVSSPAIVTIKTNMGDIGLELYTKDAPNTVANFIKLAKSGFYDGVKFHRVIEGFMIQSGDPLTKDDSKKDYWGTGGPGYEFDDEINTHLLVKGSIAMANAGANTNGSQFFIVTAESTPWLDGKHTNFGYVTSGLNTVSSIENVKTDENDRPISDVVINSIEIK